MGEERYLYSAKEKEEEELDDEDDEIDPEDEKKIKIYLARCTFCSQCNDICPVNCLSMSSEFLLADTEKYSKDLIVE